MNIQHNISLKPYNSFGISVYAKNLTTFSSVEELVSCLNHAKSKHLTHCILGGGSNILFTKDFDGIILKNEITGISLLQEDSNHFYVQAHAGVGWHQLVLFCIKNNYAGLENLSLIPGNVGAAPMQNIGAYGVELKDVLHTVTFMDIETRLLQTYTNQQCNFGYRDSIFKQQLKSKTVIISIVLKLNKTPKFNIEYGAIKQELEAMGVQELSIKNISQAVINIRSSKLPNPAQIGNAGSFFKNPIVSTAKKEELQKAYPQIPVYAFENNFKIAAGWLIEQCGFKGYRQNDVGCHAKQALVLVNYGNATGKEVYDLSTQIVTAVNNKFGINLEREVNIL